MTKVVVGAGMYRNNPSWEYTQEEELSLLRREDWDARFEAGSLDAILAEHVWEHLTYEEAVEAAVLCREFLRDGGHIRCAVPDCNFPNEEYRQMCQVGGPGDLNHPAASHKMFYSYETLSQMFEAAGFEVRLLEYCDEQGVFHENDWEPADGVIYRSRRYDHRNQDGVLRVVSLIVDAVKK
ncbi:SAM-dependent methyltransferase [Tumebacillus sp. ITR2]|uniref:SAM-dependent methyltransferase n=1 Tax=Tumebacillus amylolyticus TaxID=2801339 RepID=A0ABS1JBM6_9BACL|nr:methyltransferase domain-containing protein [Tumebacillus amylolyticus]MBL0387439.1 SAM-dependent methyltransferase [Tumebacillus amylolyticus]